MMLKGILPFARYLLQQVLQEGDIAVDATAGNGIDSLFLAQKVGESGKVYSFDIQHEALSRTKKRLEDHNVEDRVELILHGHEEAASFIPQQEWSSLKAAIFNLGYLPNGNKEITTRGETTVQAISDLLEMMPSGSIIILVIYHGHEEGKEEKEIIESFTKELDQKRVHALRYEFINQRNDPPFILALEKR